MKEYLQFCVAVWASTLWIMGAMIVFGVMCLPVLAPIGLFLYLIWYVF